MSFTLLEVGTEMRCREAQSGELTNDTLGAFFLVRTPTASETAPVPGHADEQPILVTLRLAISESLGVRAYASSR